MQNGGLQVHVQPQARLPHGRVCGVEALVRWEHPTLGWIGPEEFIPVAERSGLIGPLTTLVLEASLAACARWRAGGHDLGVAVNLSTRSLQEPGLVNEVAGLLQRYGVPAHRLTLEVTEGSVMADPTRAVDLLHQLRGLGVRLSVDDFGTGYSSLSYLQRLPVQEVKIDRSFVTGLDTVTDNVAIVRAIIDLGRHLGLEVVAEGVEDEATWDLLTALGLQRRPGLAPGARDAHRGPAPLADGTRGGPGPRGRPGLRTRTGLRGEQRGTVAASWQTAPVPPQSPSSVETGVPRPSGLRTLAHIGLTGLLGIAGAVIGAPVVVASLFGGGTTFLITLTVVVAVVSVLAVALDRATGPRRGGSGGSVLRGLTVGVLGSAAVVVIGFASVRLGVASVLPVPLRFAAAALPFAVVAALQWPGMVRRVTAVVLVVTAAVVVVPRVLGASAEQRREAIVRDVGTTARPWVTDIDGLDGLAPRTTGSEYLWTDYVVDGEPTPVVSLLRMPNAAAMGGDPCRGMFHTPEGTVEASSCRSADGVTWEREDGIDWRQVVRRVDGTWLGATARPDVPERLLEEALRNARPMSDDEYEDWLDAILTVPLG